MGPTRAVPGHSLLLLCTSSYIAYYKLLSSVSYSLLCGILRNEIFFQEYDFLGIAYLMRPFGLGYDFVKMGFVLGPMVQVKLYYVPLKY